MDRVLDYSGIDLEKSRALLDRFKFKMGAFQRFLQFFAEFVSDLAKMFVDILRNFSFCSNIWKRDLHSSCLQRRGREREGESVSSIKISCCRDGCKARYVFRSGVLVEL